MVIASQKEQQNAMTETAVLLPDELTTLHLMSRGADGEEARDPLREGNPGVT